MSIKRFTPDRHFQLIERILHDIVRIQLVDLVHDRVDIAAHRVGEEQELGPGQRLETSQSESICLKEFQSCSWNAGIGVAVA